MFPTLPAPVLETSPSAKEGFLPAAKGRAPAQRRACSFSILRIRDYCSLGMVPRCHKTLLLVEKGVCCSLKKNKSLTLYKTCAAVAPLTPCESVWVGKESTPTFLLAM